MNTESVQEARSLDTTFLMTGSAVFLGVLGLSAVQFPEELLAHLGGAQQQGPLLLANVTGMLCLGFAILNWMARDVPIGGIYGRPLTLGNFMHFFGGTITLITYVVDNPDAVTVIAIALGYAVFAAGFGYVAFAGGGRCG